MMAQDTINQDNQNKIQQLLKGKTQGREFKEGSIQRKKIKVKTYNNYDI